MLPRRALIVLAVSLLAHQDAIAQPPIERPGANGGVVAPPTPDGRPDLQGVWSYATATPLQRFPEFVDRPFISDEEAAAWVAQQLETRSADIRNTNPTADLARENNEFWFEPPTEMARLNGRIMTSLVVDPPNGRVPIAPDSPKEAPRNLSLADNPEERLLNERCIMGTGPDFHLVERFSLAAPDVLLCEFTITNPKVFSQPWTAVRRW